MVKIVIGPVVGQVTSSTARILVEVDDDAELTVVAEPVKGGDSQSATREFEDGEPGVFKLTNLRPDTRYTFIVEGVDNRERAEGSFETFPSHHVESLNIGVLSCNDVKRHGRKRFGHWENLRDQWVKKGRFRMLLHMGDQVYADKCFKAAKKILGPDNTDPTEEQDKEITELWHELYIRTWNMPAARDVLANVSNLMIWDDHEIRDDFGSKPDDRDPSSQDFFIGLYARRAFKKYQLALHKDHEPESSSSDERPHEAHVHQYCGGEFAVVFLDQRSARSFTHSERDKFGYLGSPQWEWLHDLFGEDGELEHAKAVVIVTSVPLCFLNTKATTFGAKFGVTDDLMDHWAHADNVHEQVRLVELIEEWTQRGREHRREILICGGDVHIGTITEIDRDGHRVCRQLVASAIQNVGPSGAPFKLLKRMQKNGPHIGPTKEIAGLKKRQGLTFTHGHWTNRPNFGSIQVYLGHRLVSTFPGRPPTRFRCEVVKASGVRKWYQCGKFGRHRKITSATDSGEDDSSGVDRNMEGKALKEHAKNAEYSPHGAETSAGATDSAGSSIRKRDRLHHVARAPGKRWRQRRRGKKESKESKETLSGSGSLKYTVSGSGSGSGPAATSSNSGS